MRGVGHWFRPGEVGTRTWGVGHGEPQAEVRGGRHHCARGRPLVLARGGRHAYKGGRPREACRCEPDVCVYTTAADGTYSIVDDDIHDSMVTLDSKYTLVFDGAHNFKVDDFNFGFNNGKYTFKGEGTHTGKYTFMDGCVYFSVFLLSVHQFPCSAGRSEHQQYIGDCED